jgi:hypothetical protein
MQTVAPPVHLDMPGGWELVCTVAVLAAWPVWTVLHSDVPMSVTQVAGIATCALGVFALWCISRPSSAVLPLARPLVTEASHT